MRPIVKLREFLREFVCVSHSKVVRRQLEFVGRLLAAGRHSAVTRRRLALAVSENDNWSALHRRTRQLHKSCLANALRPWLSPEGRNLLDATRPRLFQPEDVLQGKTLVV
jgi:hypothetical protein